MKGGALPITLAASSYRTALYCRLSKDDEQIGENATIHPALPGGLFVCHAYTYDALGQLIRVVDGQKGATWEYTYDQGGNILSKKKYVNGELDESKTFTYGNANWRDQLTAVNGVGITYDAIGNPLNDGTWTYTWQNGRQLKKMQKSGETVEFVYNENGLRVQKTATSTGVTKYTLHGKNIVHMTQGSNELHFFYDAQNNPAVVVYNGVPYSYVKNLQGDIVGILDSNKNVVVSYVYDAWGRPISCLGTMANTLGKINPFRYRGYVYDEETELYYLQSRYYAPNLCRFVNSDTLICELIAIGAHNIYAYCNNNPIPRSDVSGTAWWHWAIGVAVVAACAIAVVVTAGGATAGLLAVTSVANGLAATTTASTIAAGAFVGSATALGVSAIYAGLNSTSLEEFADYGDWGVVEYTAFGGICGATVAGIRKHEFEKRNQFGTKMPNKRTDQPAANSVYYQLNSEGEGIKSVTYYDDHGRQWYRYDYLGKPHRGVIPHIHQYIYHIGAPIEEIVYDLNWNQIDPPLK